MKKNVLGIYIVMIVIGIVGLFFYINQSRVPASSSAPQQAVPQETIAVAVARRDLKVGDVLQADDFQLKNRSVAQGSADLTFNLAAVNPLGYALKSAVQAESLIPPSALVQPGSDDYLAMFIKPESVIYPFTLDDNDSYLLQNLVAGQGVDIYLSYGLDAESNDVVSPARSIRDSRMKALMLNKRVLAVKPATPVKKNGVEIVERGSQVVVELQHYEVKMLKELQDKNARVFLFPAVAKTRASDAIKNSILPEKEAAWPVKEDEIFTTVNEVDELRG
ncbi:pilus assembly protein CpaB [Enterobacter sp. BIGb0383]|uniref:SAF domain-containing protein n=1 Tax=unclassified Enterobacter TaxID=2608935 RepID=UPI000F47E5C5|nr:MULTISPECIES: SAF domain-containing protein [unclassified Enterobacter]ROP59628.1 pilus assembly protein CpaB [Enterobacter sp. BIGb0383]ROS08904.1 pilus assembly protein CpaB [Enterobacter sp. BIGb0359]